MLGRYAVYRELSGSSKRAVPFFEMLDWTAPGETCMTDMLNGLHSIQRTSLIVWTADLDVEYNPFQGVGLLNVIKRSERGQRHLRLADYRANIDDGTCFALRHYRYHGFAHTQYCQYIGLVDLLCIIECLVNERPETGNPGWSDDE